MLGVLEIFRWRCYLKTDSKQRDRDVYGVDLRCCFGAYLR